MTDSQRAVSRARSADDFADWTLEELKAELHAVENYDARGKAAEAEAETGSRPSWFNPWVWLIEADAIRTAIEGKRHAKSAS